MTHQGVGVRDRAPGDVDEEGAVGHGRQEGVVDEVPRRRGEGRDDDDDVVHGQQLRQVVDRAHRPDEVVTVAGRVMYIRNTGKLAFGTLQEGIGTRLQVMLSLAEVGEGTSLAEVVAGLNALGVAPLDMIDILKSIKAAGALHAEFVVR